MSEYHKIQTVFLRDPETNFRTLLDGQYARPEFAFLADLEWEWTEKIDGTNICVVWDGDKVRFGGKTDRAQIPARLVEHLVRTFSADVMRAVFDGGPVCLYGEGCGAKIQKGGGNYYQDQRVVLFDARVGQWWLQRADVQDVAIKLDIPFAPVVGRGSLPEMVEFVQRGFGSQWGAFPAEGIVARPVVELADRGGRRVITKLKGRDFAGAKP